MTKANAIQKRWMAKVAAWIHDPADKALVLFRLAGGHESGVSADLRDELFGAEGPSEDIIDIVRRADQWASAADRPQYPRKTGEGRYPAWTRVDFQKNPELVHPMDGTHYKLDSLAAGSAPLDLSELQSLDFGHFQRLIVKDGEGIDWYRTLLSFWRFGPIPPEGSPLGMLWRLLPGDTRVPDHSIWDHLRFTSALAGAMVGPDGEPDSPALLIFSLGPIQPFIAQARKTMDLWAGSHLLSRMSWEAMRVFAEANGPDSLVLPNLWAVPQVDWWLEQTLSGRGDDAGPWAEVKRWYQHKSDANPLFAGGLSNVFLAVVSRREAESLAREATARVRGWLVEQAGQAWRHFLSKLGDQEAVDGLADFGLNQIEEQFRGFPEAQWALVDWNLAQGKDGKADATKLEEIVNAFRSAEEDDPHWFLDRDYWKVLSKQIEHKGVLFYNPNPGALYPLLYDVVKRLHGAAKTLREFDQVPQEGFRCTLCGEREFLAASERDRGIRPSSADSDKDIWSRIQEKTGPWLKNGERLCGLCSLKRAWPDLFRAQAAAWVGQPSLTSYVVSTHTMALAPTLEALEKARYLEEFAGDRLSDVTSQVQTRADLPKKLAGDLTKVGAKLQDFIRKLPVWLDEQQDQGGKAYEEALGRLNERLKTIAKDASKSGRRIPSEKVESYYALLVFDGDKMGEWLSGHDRRPPYEKLWHSQISGSLAAQAGEDMPPALRQYLTTKAAASPQYHGALSEALNGFSQKLTRLVFDDSVMGKVIYSGGDDLMAMVSVADVLPAILQVRLLYSGLAASADDDSTGLMSGFQWPDGLKVGQGHVLTGGHLMRVLGSTATGSMGVVIAHHTHPLADVLAQARKAESMAKNLGGRDAVTITVLKRSGGAESFTAKWFPLAAALESGKDGVRVTVSRTVPGMLYRLGAVLGGGMSRRAAYQIMEWLRQLGAVTPGRDGWDAESARSLLETVLLQQFKRHRSGGDGEPAAAGALQEYRLDDDVLKILARDLVAMSMAEWARRDAVGVSVTVNGILIDAIAVAEFLGRRIHPPISTEETKPQGQAKEQEG